MNYLSLRRALGPLLGVALLGLTVGPALAQAAGKHHEPLAHHSNKKKTKKKGGTQVIVHCASVGVSCKGRPGPAGPQGPAGAPGAPGAPGANGAVVILRARGGGTQLPAMSSSCGEIFCGGSIPLNPDIWTQGAGEDDQFIGTATVQIPSEEACGAEESSTKKPDRIILIASVDGKIEGLSELEGQTGATTVTADIAFDLGIEALEGASEGIGPGFLLGGEASQSHVVTVEGEDDCVTANHATVSSLSIDVLGTT
jgi:hypothetical protein